MPWAGSTSLAFQAGDQTPPSVPNSLSANAVSSSEIDLTWSASTDSGSGVAGYRVYRNGSPTPIAFTSFAFYNDTGLTPSTTYTYKVSAVDNATNESTQSTQTQATTQAGGVAGDAADWAKRSTISDVVWAYNFGSAAEVNQFRWENGTGNDPNNLHNSTLLFDNTDGIGGTGCMVSRIPTGGIANGNWNRPMAALPAGALGNGKATADPAAFGTVKLRSYDPTNSAQDFNFTTGYYGPLSTQATYPTWKGDTAPWDGTEIWVQFRAKISGSRWSNGNPSGKLVFIDVTGVTGFQEIVVQSENLDGAAGGQNYFGTNPFRMYTSHGSEPNSLLTVPQGTGSQVQPGGPYAATCQVGSFHAPNVCWCWPPDEWVVVLMHLIPGEDGNDQFYGANPASPLSAWPKHDTVLEAWVQRPAIGETDYTKVYEAFNVALDYWTNGGGASGLHPPAFNKVGPTGYMNDNSGVAVPAAVGWDQKFTEIIMSKGWLPPVGVTAPAFWTA